MSEAEAVGDGPAGAGREDGEARLPRTSRDVVEGVAAPRSARRLPKGSAVGMYVESVATTVKAVLPQSVSAYLGPGKDSGSAQKDTTDVLLHAELHRQVPRRRHVRGAKERVLLGMAYTSGFQVWDCSDSDYPKEVISFRGHGIGQMRFLEPPHNSQLGLLAGDAELAKRTIELHPLIALQAAVDSPEFSTREVQLFSMKTRKVVQVLKFSTPVVGVRSGPRVLLVALADKIFAFSALTLQHAFGVSCYENPSNDCVMAAHDRWIAYAPPDLPSSPAVATAGLRFAGTDPGFRPTLDEGAHPPLSDGIETKTDEVSTAPVVARPSASEYGLWDVAKDIASGLYFLREAGTEMVKSYSVPHTRRSIHQMPARGQTPDSGEPGCLMVRDCHTGNVVAHFRAHSSALAAVSFSNDGALVATADRTGQSVHVYRMMPTLDTLGQTDMELRSGAPQQQLLFRLERGLTHANITRLRFSSSGQWLVATSAVGTAHVFSLGEDSTGSKGHLVPPRMLEGQNARPDGGGPRMAPEAVAEDGRPAQQGPRTGAIPVVRGPCLRLKSAVQNRDVAVASTVHHVPTTGAPQERPRYSGGGSAVDGVAVLNSPVVDCLFVQQGLATFGGGGILTRYLLRSPPASPHTLVAHSHDSWDVLRRTAWAGAEFGLLPVELACAKPARPLDIRQVPERVRADWLSHADTHTYAPPAVPLWLSRQLRLHRIDPILTTADKVQLPAAFSAAESSMAHTAGFLAALPDTASKAGTLSHSDLLMRDVVSMPLPVRRSGPIPVHPEPPKALFAPDVYEEPVDGAQDAVDPETGAAFDPVMDYDYFVVDTAQVPNPVATAPPIPQHEVSAGLEAALHGSAYIPSAPSGQDVGVGESQWGAMDEWTTVSRVGVVSDLPEAPVDGMPVEAAPVSHEDTTDR